MTHVDIINLWPTLSDFADDLGIRYGTAKAMRRRGSVPAEYWATLVRRADERGFDGITLEVLVSSVAKEPAE